MTKHIGILGGTFDPVHNGHIACADFVLRYCALDEVRLMPCHLPAHRATPGVSATHRAAMVQLALQGHNGLALETLELDKHSPSYTVDSLQLLRARQPQHRWYFIIGMDSLSNFCSWKNWQLILQHCHLLVCQRPGCSALDGDAPALLAQYGADCMATLQRSASGSILLLPNPLADISASQIRQQLANTVRCNETVIGALDPAVLNYIQTQQLYQA